MRSAGYNRRRGELNSTGKGNLVVVFDDSDIETLNKDDGRLMVHVKRVDVFDRTAGEVINHLGDEVMKVFRVE